MNLVLHQFRKEFRWLRPRWALFLVVLAFDFAFSMEWVFPMRLGGLYGTSEILTGVLWLVAWWVALSTAPEDDADAGRSFVWTRPLPRLSYWLARLLVWGLLIVLPMMIEVGAYLAIMRRPWGEIGRGMLEELLVAGLMTSWVLPGAFLFRGWERYVALVLFAALWGAEYGRQLLRPLFELIYIDGFQTYPFMEPVRFAWAAGIVGPLMVLLLLWHQRGRLSLLPRHAVFAALALGTYALAASPLWRGWFDEAADQERARRLAEVARPRIRGEEFDITPQTHAKLGRSLYLKVPIATEGVPQGVIPIWSSTRPRITQHGRVLPMETRENRLFSDPNVISHWIFARPLAGDLPHGWPMDSLTVDSDMGKDWLQLPTLQLPADLDTPVDMDMKLSANWVRLRELGHAPLKAGARIISPEAELEVLEVRLNANSHGSPRPGAVTLVIRQHLRTLSTGHAMWPTQPIITLHAPGKRLLWQRAVHSGGDHRSIRQGWMRVLAEMTFGDVMAPGTGVTEANVGEQQLLWMMPEFLGRSGHEVQVKGVELGRQKRQAHAGPWTTAALDQAMNPRQLFLKAARRITRPALEAPEADAARYVAAVYAAARAYEERATTNSFAEPLWPGDDREVAELLAPYIAKHPALISRLFLLSPRDFTDHVLRAALLHAGIPGFQREPAAGSAFYQRTVAVPGQPGAWQSFMGDLWASDFTAERVKAAVQSMLETGSDEPMQELLARGPSALEKVWQDFPALANAPGLRQLCRDPAYREKAVAEVNRQYARLTATAKLEEGETAPVVAAKAALGDAGALGWVLRGAGLQDEERGHGLSVSLSVHTALFDRVITLREVPEFIRRCRDWTPEDFHYDAQKMIWVPNAETSNPPPKKP